MKSATLILPNQLFAQHPGISKDRLVILIEHHRYFSDFKFHKQKLILHRASMQAYCDELRKKGLEVIYIDFAHQSDLLGVIKKNKITELHAADFTDHAVTNEIMKGCKKDKIKLIVYESPMFLTPLDFIKKELGSKKSYFMHSFYVAQRKRMNLLMHNGKPIGGAWSFDEENRKKAPKDLKIPPLNKMPKNKYVKNAGEYIEKNFKNNPGDSTPFNYPTTHKEAETQFDDFLMHRFAHFGDYQDAIITNESFLFHSILTPALNIGLITPDFVVLKALEYAKQHKISINNLEGFIRQIIGWREFVRAVYLMKGEAQSKSNFFDHSRKLPQSFWTATTGLAPLDDVISKVLKHAYAHHIERLMVLGNFMLLSGINPNEAYQWFMELFIDSYDWVMVPNVYGMSQYADGGLMTTKPYISSSKYLIKMSNYKKGNWCEIWDALYWNFISENHAAFLKIPRAKLMISPILKMETKKINDHTKVAKNFLATFV